jgi:hypothetical protein
MLIMHVYDLLHAIELDRYFCPEFTAIWADQAS